MVRPRKRRRLARRPQAMIYKPAGVPLADLRQVALLAEELEALRLSDLEGLSQVEAARQMGVSRSTFQRTLAHRGGSLGADGWSGWRWPRRKWPRMNADERGCCELCPCLRLSGSFITGRYLMGDLTLQSASGRGTH
jgi:predicted DNA-binding protein (UPF0251 family)